MKVAKILGIVIGSVLLLVLVVGAIALIPGVQTWAVRKAVADKPDMKIEVSRVAAGLSSADVRDFRFEKDGLIVTAKGVNANYSALDYLTGGKINADSVVVQDILIDARNVGVTTPGQTGATAGNATPGTTTGSANKSSSTSTSSTASAPGKAEPFKGVLSQAQLPFSLRVAHMNVKGRALLPENRTASFDIQGTGVETGKRGKIDVKAELLDPSPSAAVKALRVAGTIAVHITTDQRIDLFEVDLTASAEGPNLPTDQLKLEVKAEQPGVGTNEAFALNISLLRNGKLEPLLKGSAQYQIASREFSGAWDLAIRTEQLAAVLVGLGLPEIAANGGGKFTFKPDTGAATASGDLHGRASGLEKVKAELASIGPVDFRTLFDGGLADNVARLEKLQFDLTAANGKKLAEVATTQRISYGLTDKKLTLADPKAEAARLNVQALPLAYAQPFVKDLAIESGDLSLTLAVQAEPDGSRVLLRPVQPLSLRAITVSQKGQKLVDQLTITMNPKIDYAGTRATAELADLTISMPTGDRITGVVSADVTNLTATQPTVAFATQLQGKAVAVHKPYVKGDIGAIVLALAVQGRLEGDTAQVSKASASFNRDGGPLLASFDLQQAVSANTKTSTVAAANPAAPVARLKLGEVPLAWAEPYLEKSKLGGALAGGTFDVTFRTPEDLALTAVEPLALRGVTAALDGQSLVQSLDITVALGATLKGKTIGYDLRRMEVKQGNTLLTAVTASGEAKLPATPDAKLALTAKGSVEADLPALTTQPALAQFATLAKGTLAVAFDATQTDVTQAKVLVTAKNLVAKENNRVLGDLEVNLNANVKADGSGTISAPLTLTSAARKSDIAINGTFGKSSDQKTFLLTGKIASNNIVIDDFMPLAGLAPKNEPAKTTPPATTPAPRPGTTPSTRPSTPPVATTPPSSTPGRDTEPFWKGVNGKIELDLKRILYGKDYVISAVRGSAVVTDSKLSLDGLEGRFKENPFKVAGGVAFAAAQPKPYSLNASADVQGLNIGDILKAANPNEVPQFETIASLTARLNGTGGTVAELGKNAYGKFEMSGTKGITRIFGNKKNASTAVNVASLALGILGAAKGSQTATALSELTQLLNEIHFDQIKVQVERAPDLSFKITSLEILSPILRATGSGTVDSKSTDDIANAPMHVVLQLGAKDSLLVALRNTKLLGGQADEKGYALMSRTFTFGGTPSKPDNSSLWGILAEVGAQGALQLLGR